MEELQAALKGNDVCDVEQHASSITSDQGKEDLNQECDLVICSYKDQKKTPVLHTDLIRLQNIKSHSDPLELSNNEDIDESMLEYLNSRRHSHSSTREFRGHNLFPHEKPSSLDIGLEECYLEAYYPESRQSDIEIVYIDDEDDDINEIRKDSFSVLSPIEENSEKAEESAENESISSSNNSNETKKKSTTRIQKIVSHSFDHIPNSYSKPIDIRDECQTLPRAKTTSIHTHRELWNSLRFPTEPRELDPSAYHQLHTADSQEELQEFLLLESECMTDGKNQGLASAFTVSDEGPRIFYSDGTNDDRGTVSGSY